MVDVVFFHLVIVNHDDAFNHFNNVCLADGARATRDDAVQLEALV